MFGAALVVATMVMSVNGQVCPGVSPVAVNATEFIAESWFIQKQQTVPYQPQDELYCVVATYDRDTSNDDFVLVGNSAKTGGVDGQLQDGAGICAELLEPGVGRLRVAPCFLRTIGLFGISAGPYWVIAVDEDYEWVIISGGPPTEPRSNGTCTTKSSTDFFDTNGSGLWLFSRVPTGELAEEYTTIMLETLDELGIYKGDLKDVMQEGCDYRGQPLKPPRVYETDNSTEPTFAPTMSPSTTRDSTAPTVAPSVKDGAAMSVVSSTGAVAFTMLAALALRL